MQTNLPKAHEQSLVLNRAFDFTNEIKDLDVDALKMTLKKLNYLSFEIDPYDLDGMGQEEKTIIEEFNISDFLANPFEFTNILLKMIDTTESLINNKYQ